ncbi:M48 family metallopeptidase [Mycobacterium sp. URHB0044]|uniref:M48 family metallopeptidase n=1 Tax=Mycobacterium sp. URHB0044 TaxID=1380386 RepID=UPI000AEFF4FB|nr:M48 family metallopeptidase [Mycobacterium sp. URHB0044]
MKYTLRAMLAVSMLAGFYLVGLAIVVALAYVGYLFSVIGIGLIAGCFWILAVVVAVAIGKSIAAQRKHGDPGRGSVLLGEEEQPELWHEVRELAGFAGTRPPDEIRLVAVANAAVSEDSTLLGLVGGTRRMFLGAPLLIGFTRQQLRAVLAHELGHYSGRHTALGALTYRGQEAIARVLDDLEDSFARKPLELYGDWYLAISQAVNRRQEFEADRLSAELVGGATAAEALRQNEVLVLAWRLFLDRYVAPGEDFGCRPRDLFDGFRRFVDDPERRRQLAEAREDLPEPPRSVYDSHPPTAERLAAFLAVDGGAAQPDVSEPAMTMLRDPQADLARLADVLYADTDLRPAEFEEMVPLAARSGAALMAQILLDVVRKCDVPSPTLGGVVAALKQGQSEALLGLVENSELDHPDGRRQTFARILGHAIAHALIEDGSATYELDWGGPPRLVDAAGEPLDPLTPAYEALSGDDDAVAALEEWLDRHGVRRDLEMPPLPVEKTPVQPTRWLGLLAPVNEDLFSRRAVFGVADSGLLICRPRFRDHWAAAIATHSFRDAGRTYVNRLAAQQPADVLANGRARHLAWDDIASIVARNGPFKHSMRINTRDGSTLRLEWPATAHMQGKVWATLTRHVGERFKIAS